MYTHGSSCLEGPVSRNRIWWTSLTPDLATNLTLADLEALGMDKSREKSPVSEQPIRTELVERIRREIAAGVYETPEKFAIALDRLLTRLDSEK